MSLQTIIQASVQDHLDEYMTIVQSLYDNPELGLQEFKSMALLADFLEARDFQVTRQYIVETGFIARYDSKKPGPTIAFLCEYDALPEIGHGCGHNLIAAIGVAAGIAYQQVIDQIGGQVWVVGTPAEENFGGKVTMSEAGVFDTVDLALMVHPSNHNGLGSRSSALYPLKFDFFGRNAHGCHPHEGASALDAAVMTYLQINLMRQFVSPDTFIHGIVRDGGAAANIIPGHASLEYYFRAPYFADAKALADQAQRKAEAIAQANDCRVEALVYECPYEDTVINYRLAEVLKEEWTAIGVPEIAPVTEIPTGSTDVGAVSYRCPTIQGYIKIVPETVVAHTIEMREATISSDGRWALEKAAQGIALTALRVATDEKLYQEIQTEQADTLAQLGR